MKRIASFFNRVFRMEEINGNNVCPTYCYRWTLLKLGPMGVYLHKFVGDDWSVDLHDHPKRFWSIGLRGAYMELRPHVHGICSFNGGYCSKEFDVRVYIAPWFRTFPADHIHRLTGPTPEHPCWTLVIVGRAVRPWGFWRDGSFVPWRKYVERDNAQARRSCP